MHSRELSHPSDLGMGELPSPSSNPWKAQGKVNRASKELPMSTLVVAEEGTDEDKVTSWQINPAFEVPLDDNRHTRATSGSKKIMAVVFAVCAVVALSFGIAASFRSSGDNDHKKSDLQTPSNGFTVELIVNMPISGTPAFTTLDSLRAATAESATEKAAAALDVDTNQVYTVVKINRRKTSRRRQLTNGNSSNDEGPEILELDISSTVETDDALKVVRDLEADDSESSKPTPSMSTTPFQILCQLYIFILLSIN